LSIASVLAIGAGLIVLGGLFHTEIASAVAVWQNSTAYNHCFLVIPIVVYLLWDRRESLREAVAVPFPAAALAGIPLAFVWLVAECLGIMEGRQLVAMTFAELLFFVVLGPRLWWLLAGPLLYLYFLVPFGAFLTPTLQDFTTVFVAHGLPLLHIPAYITGYTIEIPEGTFLIAEACAGLRFLIAAIAFGCLYALVLYRSPLRRVLFIGASIIVPAIANGFRALGIVALGHYLGSAQAVEADHVLYGWVFFSIVILILIVLGLPFREDQQPAKPSPSWPGHAPGLVPGVSRPSVAAGAMTPGRDKAGHDEEQSLAQTTRARAMLLGTLAVMLLAACGPAIAVQFDRVAAPDLVARPMLPALAGPCSLLDIPPAPQSGAPGTVLIERFDCGNGPVTLIVEVFSPRSTVVRLAAEQRRLTESLQDEDVQTQVLSLPNAPAAWRLTEATKTGRAAATSLWVDGKPAQLGLAGRARQAWRSLFGGKSHPVLVVVTTEENRTAPRIEAFLRAQPGLPDAIGQLAGVTD
jgi:exosortase A